MTVRETIKELKKDGWTEGETSGAEVRASFKGVYDLCVN